MKDGISRRRFASAAALLLGASTLALGGPAQGAEPIKIGFGMALTGGLAANGKSALLAQQIWAADVNAKGGLLGRQVQLVYYDDQSNPATIPGLYTKLLDVDKVDLVVGGYATNMLAPAMPVVMQHNMAFIGLLGLAVNSQFNYPKYFAMIPSGPDPKTAFSEGFFDVAMQQNPTPKTVAIVGADAEFAKNAADGARINAKKHALKVVYDRSYPPSTTDYTPIVRAIQATNPDLVYVASYPPDSAGMVRAVNEVGLKTRMFGGGLVGPQFAALKAQLGPLLNGVVNYEFYVPDLGQKFPGLQAFLAKYQGRAAKEGVDPLGFYLPPYAYAMMQVLEQAVAKVGSLDQAKLAAYIHKSEFDTFVGKVRFAPNGEWAKSRVMMTQYHGISGNDAEQFKQPGKVTVLSPKEYRTGDVKTPYQDNKK